ncbi:zinc-dependent peptidase [Thiolapillus sp.]|uniref:M90 family metallopeptidase n=1 Tax=Thiolapillus sp. TaxID=2017437 RepID=UPI003AF99E04
MIRHFFKRLQISHILRRHAIPQHLWHSVCEELHLLQNLTVVEKTRLQELSTLFLRNKVITGVDLQISDRMRVIVAAQACLPVLDLGTDLLEGWRQIVIYPDAFRVSRDEPDQDGIVHHEDRVLSGEAWSRGPVIFSWGDIEQDIRHFQEGHNVIVHEIAHKLDMRNGRANGMPPLHAAMQTAAWTEAFSAAYERLEQRLEHHQRVCVNPYAATSPAEFFAVFSEYFFTAPEILHSHFPAVHEQLRLYYRQDPLQRGLSLSGR